MSAIAVVALAYETPIVVFTGASPPEIGEKAIREGAQDGKVSSELLTKSIAYAIERHKLIKAEANALLNDAVTRLPSLSMLYEMQWVTNY